jgi:MoaA/NifB/PqqE/SkfB family radical SAM enzyme
METKKIVKGMPTYLEKIEGINFKDDSLIFLMFSVPPICNYRCKKCSTSAGSRKVKNLLTLEEIFRIIKEGKELGVRNVSILGEGEPLIYKNIKEVIEYTDKLGMILTISTNGRMLTKDMADFLYKHNTVLGISLDTLNEKEYNSYCGGNASLKEVLKNIDYVRKLYSKKIYEEKGYKIYQLLIHTTVTAKNFDELRKIEDFCGEDIFFDCQSLYRAGNAKKNISFFKGYKKNYKNFQKFGHLIKPPMVLSKTESGKCICCLFHYGISVACNGEVMFDAHVKESMKFIGNIRNHSLKLLVKRRNKLRDFYLKNYNLSGYCPIREESAFNKFKRDLKEFKCRD